MLRNAKKVDKESLKLSNEFLEKVSGGSGAYDDWWIYEFDECCRWCGTPGFMYFVDAEGPFAEYCKGCGWNYVYDEDMNYKEVVRKKYEK